MSDNAALEILQKLLNEACEESLLPAIVQEKQLRAVYGPAQQGVKPDKQSELVERTPVVDRAGLDIYGQEKPTDTKYFGCSNCGRQIAGNRFAAHVAKCVTRGRRQKSAF